MLAEGFYGHTDKGVCGRVGEKDEIETERVAVSEGDWAGQTG